MNTTHTVHTDHHTRRSNIMTNTDITSREQREATAVVLTVQTLTRSGLISEGTVHNYRVALNHLSDAMLSQDLLLTADNADRLIGNVYADIRNAYNRRLALTRQIEAIANDGA